MSSMARAGLRLLLAGACLALAACAPLKVLTAEEKARIKEVHLQVVVPQETFMFSAQAAGASAALGGGLLGAMIDSAVQKSRQDDLRASVQPVLDELLDADFRAEGAEALRQSAGQFPFPTSRAEAVALMPTAEEHRALVAANKADQAYVRLLVYYSIDPATRALTTRTLAGLWLQNAGEASYMRNVIYQGTPDPAAAPSIAGVRQQMREAVSQSLKLIALDVQSPAEKGSHPKRSFLFRDAQRSWPIEGELLSAEAGRAQFRTEQGLLFSLQEAKQ